MARADSQFSRVNYRVVLDRRRAAVHEAGHYVVARHLKMPVTSCWIVPEETSDIDLNFTWVGRTQLYLSRKRWSEIRKAMIACAGVVAESVWDARLASAPECWLWDCDWDDPDLMSEGDWRLAGCAPGEPNRRLGRAVEKTWNLLAGDLRWALFRTARRLIRGEHLTWPALPLRA